MEVIQCDVLSSASGFIDVWGGGWCGIKQADDGGAYECGETEVEAEALMVQVRRARAPAFRSFGTGADHGGCRWKNQRHVDTLRAVLWTDDFSQTFGPRLAQQFT